MPKRVCVVGAGRWGKNHIRTLAELGALAGVVDADPEKRKALGETYPTVSVFSSIDETLGEAFDGFTIATPAETHFEIAKALLERGVGCLVEKPMTMTAADTRTLVSLAKRRNAPLMVGHVMLFHPAIRLIKQLVDAGKIGHLQYLYSNRLNLGTVRTEENILWSFAPHDISIFQYLIGDRPEEVISRGGAFVQPHLHDTTMTVLAYPGNIVGHIFVSWLHPFKEHRLVVMGSKGMLSFEDGTKERHLHFYEKGIDFVNGAPIKRDGPTEAIPYAEDMPLTEELRYFIERLNGAPVEIADGENAVEVLEILESASRSLAGKSPEAPSAETPSTFFVHPSSYVDDDVEIGEGTKIWHFCHVQSHTCIGKGCSLGQNVNVGNNVRIGNHVKIQNNVAVYEGVEIEDYVFCGPSMVFTNVPNPRSKYPQRGSEFYKKTLVREGASIGANATIVCGHTVGRHAFIAAGAVVTSDVPDYALMMGVPARRVGWMSEAGEKLPSPDAKGLTVCPRTGRRYRLTGDVLSPLDDA